MLTFIRKIRKSLIESGNVRKYMFYAIGEIALLVIGILIALQFNNWNEWRKDRLKEKSVLMEIRETLNENIKTIDSAIIKLEKGNRSSEVVIQFLNKEISYSDTMSHHFDRSRWPLGLLVEGLSDAGYKEIEYSGFDILRCEELKNSIIKYFDKTIPQLISNFNMKDDGVFANYDEYTRRVLKDLGGPHALPVDQVEILNDNFYRSIILTIYDTRIALFRRAEEFKDQSLKLLNLIRSQLDQD